MTISQLEDVMLFHLQNFASDTSLVSKDTLHGTILSDADGSGTANSKRLYKGFVRFTIIREGHPDKAWPIQWMTLSIKQLAPKLISDE